MQPSARRLDVTGLAIPEWFNPIPHVLDEADDQPATTVPFPAASQWSLSWSKRSADFCVAVLALAVFALPMLAIAICVRLTSKGPALFKQKRVGRNGRLFAIYKFRSMADNASDGPGLTRGGDQRITSVGRWIRKFKLDELPQFVNILRGEMSLVGPRPKLPIYESIVDMAYRPGITGAATLAFRREEEILRGIHPSQLEHFYSRHIKPLKAQIDVQYMSKATLWSDLRMLAATLFACLAPSTAQGTVQLEARRESDSLVA